MCVSVSVCTYIEHLMIEIISVSNFVENVVYQIFTRLRRRIWRVTERNREIGRSIISQSDTLYALVRSIYFTNLLVVFDKQ